MNFPIDNPVFFLAILVGAALFVPMLFERIRIPGLVGLILTGVLLGPHTLGVMERNVLIQYIGQAGLLFIVFVAGLEIDLLRFAKYRKHSVIFGSISYVIPQVLGAAMAVWLLGFDLPSAILLGSMFGSHTLLTYPIVSRLGIAKSTVVTAGVGGTIVTDASALMVLAVIAKMTVGDSGWMVWVQFALLLALFLWVVFRVLPRVTRWFFRAIPDEGARDFLFVILMMLTVAAFAESAGLQPILGAFLCGLAVNRLIPDRSPLMSRVQFVGKTLLVPVFLISVGMLIDPRALFGSPRAILVVGAMSVTVVLAKLIAAYLTAKALRYSGSETGVLFGLSVNQAAATLAAVVVGFNLGLFEAAVVNGAVMMILVTCLVGPWATEHFGRKMAEAAALEGAAGADRPQRILIPLANPKNVEPLMDLALMLRKPHSRQPIFPLAIVTDDASADRHVMQADKLLEAATARGNAADAPIFPITRVDVNIADGIRRTLTEQQITTVVIGWNARPSFANRIFGNVVDQLLAQSRQAVFVARFIETLNEVEGIVILMPRMADHEPSFGETVHLLKVLSQQLSAPIRIVGPAVEDLEMQQFVRSVQPEGKVTFVPIPSFREFPSSMGAHVGERDLLVLVSARSHRVSWMPSLETLPREIAARRPNLPFLIVYGGGEDGPAKEDDAHEIEDGLR